MERLSGPVLENLAKVGHCGDAGDQVDQEVMSMAAELLELRGGQPKGGAVMTRDELIERLQGMADRSANDSAKVAFAAAATLAEQLDAPPAMTIEVADACGTLHRLASQMLDSSSWATLERAESFCRCAGDELGRAVNAINAARFAPSPAMAWQGEPSDDGIHYVEGWESRPIRVSQFNNGAWNYVNPFSQAWCPLNGRRVCPIPAPPPLPKRGDK